MKPTICTQPNCGNKTFHNKLFYWVCKKCRIAISKGLEEK